jgi:hypothetical protein
MGASIARGNLLHGDTHSTALRHKLITRRIYQITRRRSKFGNKQDVCSTECQQMAWPNQYSGTRIGVRTPERQRLAPRPALEPTQPPTE